MHRKGILIAFVGLALMAYWAGSLSNAGGHVAAEGAQEKEMVIVPLVKLKPGESTELLFSTWCTVGVTRGGGFGLSEMRDGKPVAGGHDEKTYTTNGVTMSVPSFKQGVDYAGLPEFASLKKRNLDAFRVTVKATEDAKPGLIEMHLVDRTCAGHCMTDFRVLVQAD